MLLRLLLLLLVEEDPMMKTINKLSSRVVKNRELSKDYSTAYDTRRLTGVCFLYCVICSGLAVENPNNKKNKGGAKNDVADMMKDLLEKAARQVILVPFFLVWVVD